MNNLLFNVWKGYSHNVFKTVSFFKEANNLYKVYKKNREDAEGMIADVQKKINDIKKSDAMFLSTSDSHKGRKIVSKDKNKYEVPEQNITAEPDWSFSDTFLNPYEKIIFIDSLRCIGCGYKICNIKVWRDIVDNERNPVNESIETFYIYCLKNKKHFPQILTPKFFTVNQFCNSLYYYTFCSYFSQINNNYDWDSV